MCNLATIIRALIAEWKFWDYGFWVQASKTTWLNHICFACRFKRQIIWSTNCSEANLSLTGADKKKKKSSLSLSLACAPVHGIACNGAWQESCHGVFLGHSTDRRGVAFWEIRAARGGSAGTRQASPGTRFPGCVPSSLQTTEATAAAAQLLVRPTRS